MCAKVVALCACLFSSVAALGQNNVIDEVVWVVGDEAILKSDVESERLNAQYEGRKFDGDPYCIIPEQLAVQKLFLHQAELDSVEVTEQEVLTELEWRINYIIDQIGSKEKMEEYYNKTSTQIREMIRENIRNEKTVRKMQQEIIGDIKIVPADVRRYFKNLPQAQHQNEATPAYPSKRMEPRRYVDTPIPWYHRCLQEEGWLLGLPHPSHSGRGQYRHRYAHQRHVCGYRVRLRELEGSLRVGTRRGTDLHRPSRLPSGAGGCRQGAAHLASPLS